MPPRVSRGGAQEGQRGLMFDENPRGLNCLAEGSVMDRRTPSRSLKEEASGWKVRKRERGNVRRECASETGGSPGEKKRTYVAANWVARPGPLSVRACCHLSRDFVGTGS